MLNKIKIKDKVSCKNKLPKSIYNFKGKYKVVFHSKTEKETVNAGIYDDLQMAINIRDSFIKKHINDILKGYLPRGITYVKKTNKYESKFYFQKKYSIIGYFNTLNEAIIKRNYFIDSLK